MYEDHINKNLKNILTVVRLTPRRPMKRLWRRGNKQEDIGQAERTEFDHQLCVRIGKQGVLDDVQDPGS